MPLDKEVVIGPGYTVLGGDPAPPPKSGTAAPPHFSAHVYCGQTAGWIKMPLGKEVGLGASEIVLDGDPALPTEKGTVRLCGFRHISTSGLASNGCRWPIFARNARITLRSRLQIGAVI